jgi:hypothetical protein
MKRNIEFLRFVYANISNRLNWSVFGEQNVFDYLSRLEILWSMNKDAE